MGGLPPIYKERRADRSATLCPTWSSAGSRSGLEHHARWCSLDLGHHFGHGWRDVGSASTICVPDSEMKYLTVNGGIDRADRPGRQELSAGRHRVRQQPDQRRCLRQQFGRVDPAAPRTAVRFGQSCGPRTRTLAMPMSIAAPVEHADGTCSTLAPARASSSTPRRWPLQVRRRQHMRTRNRACTGMEPLPLADPLTAGAGRAHGLGRLEIARRASATTRRVPRPMARPDRRPGPAMVSCMASLRAVFMRTDAQPGIRNGQMLDLTPAPTTRPLPRAVLMDGAASVIIDAYSRSSMKNRSQADPSVACWSAKPLLLRRRWRGPQPRLRGRRPPAPSRLSDGGGELHPSTPPSTWTTRAPAVSPTPASRPGTSSVCGPSTPCQLSSNA